MTVKKGHHQQYQQETGNNQQQGVMQEQGYQQQQNPGNRRVDSNRKDDTKITDNCTARGLQQQVCLGNSNRNDASNIYIIPETAVTVEV